MLEQGLTQAELTEHVAVELPPRELLARRRGLIDVGDVTTVVVVTDVLNDTTVVVNDVLNDVL